MDAGEPRESLTDKKHAICTEVRVITLDRRDEPRFVNHNVALRHRRNDEDQRRGL